MKIKVSALIVAAGASTRFGENKLLAKIDGQPVIRLTVSKFCCAGIDEIAVVVSESDGQAIKDALSGFDIKYALGGATRTKSVQNGLASISGDIVLIHDGARPFVTQELITRAIADTKRYGSSIAALPASDTTVRLQGDKLEYPDRSTLYSLQTPQAFFTKDITAAYKNITGEHTDDSGVFAAAGFTPHITIGEPTNKKITYPHDLQIQKSGRVGCAFDIHRLVDGRPFILGGVKLPFEKGLLGHSDADVLLHAVSGAILNALGEKDIGTFFPDTDMKNKDMSSRILLDLATSLMKQHGKKIENLSITLIAERPKLAPHIDDIKASLSRLLSLPAAQIGLAATTMEKLGAIGASEAVACMCHILLGGI